ncbi:MAG: hypothetical protein IMF12_01545 [Proteobacteria bacterium]|nr:hypothetical protein [Pseudomonadota bacterium]
MEELKAVKYGEVELIPGIKCDAYVLNDGTPVITVTSYCCSHLWNFKNYSTNWYRQKSTFI